MRADDLKCQPGVLVVGIFRAQGDDSAANSERRAWIGYGQLNMQGGMIVEQNVHWQGKDRRPADRRRRI